MGTNEVEGVLTEFGSLIPGLAAKRFDIIAAGMYVTPERCKQVALSGPDLWGWERPFLVKCKRANPKNLHTAMVKMWQRNPDAKLGVVVAPSRANTPKK